MSGIVFEKGDVATQYNLKNLALSLGQLKIYIKSDTINQEPPTKELNGNVSYILKDVQSGIVYLKIALNGVRYKVQLTND